MIAAAAIAVPAAAAVAGLTYATVAPACSFWGPVISRVPAADARAGVALTFDDGPTPGATDRVLDALRDARASATFFVIGANARRHPDLVRRMRDEGHLVGNHSLSHSHFGVLRTLAYWTREVRACDEILADILGQPPAMFRPPMGIKTWHTTRAAREAGHRLVTWSRRAIDGLPTTPRRILRRLGGATAGEILLLHDGVEPHSPHPDRSATIAAVAPLVESLRSRGLRPVRLDDLLARGKHA